jgi:hypothetical protein
MFYSWASRASIKDYPADLASNERTWHRLAAYLSEISYRGRFETIHLISHSMGGRAICQSALQMLAQQGSGSPSFKNVIFAAPDVEVPVFRNALSRIASLASRITLYFSPDDVALHLSRRFHGAPRTGEIPVVAKGLDTIDASEVIGDILGHSPFGERSVISDIYELLKEDRPPGDRFGMERIRGIDGIISSSGPDVRCPGCSQLLVKKTGSNQGSGSVVVRGCHRTCASIGPLSATCSTDGDTV